jgi:hypothetical protein
MNASTRKPTKAAAANSDAGSVGLAAPPSGSRRLTSTSPPTADAVNDLMRYSVSETSTAP